MQTGPAASAEPQSGAPDLGCYERTYAAEHLRLNPAQKTQRISVSLERNGAEGAPLPYLVGIIVRQKGSPDQWVAGGGCELEHGVYACQLDGDAGHVTVRRNLQGLRLEVVDYVALEGEETADGDLPLAELKGKADKVFVLATARSDKACQYVPPGKPAGG